MNEQLRNLLTRMEEAGFEREMEELLKKRYFNDWTVSMDQEEREGIWVKVSVIEDVLSEMIGLGDMNES